MSEEVRNGELKVEDIKIDKEQIAKYGQLLLRDETVVKLFLFVETEQMQRRKVLSIEQCGEKLGTLELYQGRCQTKY